MVGCIDQQTVYAPVVDVSVIERIPKNGVYRVSSGETLYSIAWRYGLDYRYLAARNHISPPYRIVTGELIYLRGKPVSSAKVPQKMSNQLAVKNKLPAEPHLPVKHWFCLLKVQSLVILPR